MPSTCWHQTGRHCNLKLMSGARDQKEDICKQGPESVSRRSSDGNSFLAGFWIFLRFLWCTYSKTSLDSAGGNRRLAAAILGKHILTAPQKHSWKVCLFSLFQLHPWAPEESSVVGLLRVTVVALSVTVMEELLASEIEQVYLPLQTNLTFQLLPKELFLSSGVIHVTLLLLKKTVYIILQICFLLVMGES